MAPQHCLRHSSATEKIIAAHSKRRRRVELLDFTNSVTAAFPGRRLHVNPRQPQHPQEKRALDQGPSEGAISFHADKRVLAQSGRGLVRDFAGKVSYRHLYKLQAAQEHIDA